MVQQLAPFLVLRRLTKADLVMLDSLPAHQEHVVLGLLDAALKLVAQVAGHGRDDALRDVEGDFEGGGLTIADLQLGDFEDGVFMGKLMPSF